MRCVVTVVDVRALALRLPRSTEHLVHDRVKFRVKQVHDRVKFRGSRSSTVPSAATRR
jgi:hypothetical protein